jgi:hypothetical protein
MCLLLQHLSHMQSERGRCSIRSANLGPGLARPQLQRPGPFSSVSSWPPPTAHLRRRSHRCQAMAATNKCLAQSNKSPHRANATKNPAKSGVLLVRESTISGRLQLPVYLIGGGNQILLCPITSTPIFEHLVEPLRKRRGLSGKLGRAACGRIAQPSQNTV